MQADPAFHETLEASVRHVWVHKSRCRLGALASCSQIESNGTAFLSGESAHAEAPQCFHEMLVASLRHACVSKGRRSRLGLKCANLAGNFAFGLCLTGEPAWSLFPCRAAVLPPILKPYSCCKRRVPAGAPCSREVHGFALACPTGRPGAGRVCGTLRCDISQCTSPRHKTDARFLTCLPIFCRTCAATRPTSSQWASAVALGPGRIPRAESSCPEAPLRGRCAERAGVRSARGLGFMSA